MADMSDHHSDKGWDEYAWERFLQEQEIRTEKYMELLEKYLDHPERDEIIAREMEWPHPGEGKDWEDEVDAQFHEDIAGLEDELDGEDLEDVSSTDFETNPLYRMALSFSIELAGLLAGLPDNVLDHPASVMLQSQSTMIAAKLAAALNDDDIEELGMNIAYLKRGLSAANDCLGSLSQLWQGEMLEQLRYETVRARIFEIRDGIVGTMGEYRAEFRKRHGS